MRGTVDEALSFVEVGLPAPGQRFGAYEIEAPVGQGGMGIVYRARDLHLGRAVALKVLRPDAIDEESVARFLREARLAAALEHPGIVAVYDVGEVEGTPYLAMEWIAGRTLRAAKPERPVEVLRSIAEVLAFAHARGIVHRDLKPANVMIDQHGRPKLLDFGIAKRFTAANTFATQDGVVLGTPSYMAPEQELSSVVDARADQFAWGVIAYELLTGERPSRPAIAHAALGALTGVVMRALAQSPSERFESLRALLVAWPAPAPSVPRPSPVPARRLGRLRLFALSAIPATLLCTAALAIVMRRTAPPPPPPMASAAPTSLDASRIDEPDVHVEPTPEPTGTTAAVSAKPAGPVARRLVLLGGTQSADKPGQMIELREQLEKRFGTTFDRCAAGVHVHPAMKIELDVDVGDDGRVRRASAKPFCFECPPGQAERVLDPVGRCMVRALDGAVFDVGDAGVGSTAELVYTVRSR